MKILIGLVLLASGLSAQNSKLKLQVMVSPDSGYAAASTIISGDRDAILIDPQFAKSEARKVAAAIKKSGKNLTTVYVSHGHPDHYFGLAVMKEEFPNAKLVAMPDVVPAIERGWAGRREFWLPTYGDELPTATPVLPQALAKPELTLEGHVFPITGNVTGDGPGNTFVWIPQLRAVVAGDIIFNQVHFGQPADNSAWASSLAKLEALNPKTIVGGHARVGVKHNPDVIQWMRQYREDFQALKVQSKSAAELKAKVLAKYPKLAMVSILDRETNAAFAPPTGAAKGK
jgi:glyoxylase-like metal-dependent hydrolase (beta-lactamase superfamily II)